MIEGATEVSADQSVDHLMKIIASININVQLMKITYGINSNKKSSGNLKWSAFAPFNKIPKNIYATPIITANFIL